MAQPLRGLRVERDEGLVEEKHRRLDRDLLLQYKNSATGPDHIMHTFAVMFSSYNDYAIDGRP